MSSSSVSQPSSSSATTTTNPASTLSVVSTTPMPRNPKLLKSFPTPSVPHPQRTALACPTPACPPPTTGSLLSSNPHINQVHQRISQRHLELRTRYYRKLLLTTRSMKTRPLPHMMRQRTLVFPRTPTLRRGSRSGRRLASIRNRLSLLAEPGHLGLHKAFLVPFISTQRGRICGFRCASVSLSRTLFTHLH